MRSGPSRGGGHRRAGARRQYVVLYKQESVAGNTAATIENAGGSVVASYPQIGVVIAQSGSASFRSDLMQDNRIAGAASTDGFGVDSSTRASTRVCWRAACRTSR